MDLKRPWAVRREGFSLVETSRSFDAYVYAGLARERRPMMTLTIKLEATTERDPLSYSHVPHTLRGVLRLMRDVIAYSWRESTNQLRTYPPVTIRIEAVEPVPGTDRASIAFKPVRR